MTRIRNWLPPIRDHASYDNWQDFIEEIHDIFKRDFVEGELLRYKSLPIHINSDIENQKEKTFWHLTYKTEKQKKWGRRKIRDIARAERLSWIKPIIANYSEKEVVDFDYYEGQGIVRTYLWLKKWDFVVILERQNAYYLLITAYHIDHERQKKQLCKKYRNRIT